MLVEPLTVVEIDMDRCTRTWGAAPCTAALSAIVPHKCFNTFGTCRDKAAFASAPFTLRFVEPRANLPAGLGAFPFLSDVSQITATVNIAGTDDSLGALGRTATVSVQLRNAPYHDRGVDPYQAERLTGAAQFDGLGYDPGARGTFFGKLKARWPHYTGRPLRILEGRIVGGAFVVDQTRHYVLSDWVGPDDKGVVTLKAKDPLSALNDDRALVPPPSSGVLAADVDAVAGTLTLTPAGVGDAEYPAAGRACIGSELVDFTRAGDVLTVTRAVRGTAAAGHSAGDTVQVTFSPYRMRIDDLVEHLATPVLPAALVPKAAKWKAEIDRWAPAVLVTTDVCQPTGRAKLLGELAVLGFSIFWDDVAQEMALRVNRPPDGDPVWRLSDFGHLTTASTADRNEKRLTEVLFFTVQLDPTKSATSSDNYARAAAIGDLDAKDPRAFGDRRIRKIYCRWFNAGADPVVRLLARRLLGRLNTAPVHLNAGVSIKDRQIPLAAVVEVDTDLFEDATGATLPRMMQVISREPKGAGGGAEYILQAYQFAGRYAFATENTRPTYAASTPEQRARGMYACDHVTLRMSNGDEPYRAI